MCVCVTAGDEYSVKWKKINQSTCHLFVMICLILVWYVQGGMKKELGNEEVVSLCVCVCVCGGETEQLRKRERQRESVCLDQLHSKSVYSAQFGIKHNRLLSACYCLWCPIKMEFIAALRASPNYTFFPLRSVLLSLSLSLSLICTFSFSPAAVMVVVWGFFFPHF